MIKKRTLKIKKGNYYTTINDDFFLLKSCLPNFICYWLIVFEWNFDQLDQESDISQLLLEFELCELSLFYTR